HQWDRSPGCGSSRLMGAPSARGPDPGAFWMRHGLGRVFRVEAAAPLSARDVLSPGTYAPREALDETAGRGGSCLRTDGSSLSFERGEI
ncbi:MAG: hypothetical protein AAGC93_31200, partial [Cyanobacteria bacterium P01_F01_bin.53]